jgi:hypothetical protein
MDRLGEKPCDAPQEQTQDKEDSPRLHAISLTKTAPKSEREKLINHEIGASSLSSGATSKLIHTHAHGSAWPSLKSPTPNATRLQEPGRHFAVLSIIDCAVMAGWLGRKKSQRFADGFVRAARE